MEPDIAVSEPAGAARAGVRAHVAVICPGLGGSGSVPFVALRQAQELARYMRVTLLSDSFPEHADPRLEQRRIVHSDFRFLRRFGHVPREFAFALAAKRCLFDLQAQGANLGFVHCHAHALVALAASPFGKRYRVPCGLVAHGDVFSSPPGTYDWRLTRFYKWAIPRGFARADLVVALSPHMRERAIACGADARRVEIIPNGIALEEIGLASPTPLDACAHDDATRDLRPIKILFVGKLGRIKGVDVLLRAAKVLKDGGTPFSLQLVGEGPLRGELDRFVAGNGLSGEVAFSGKLRREELGKRYRWADVTCVPSRQDLLPTVVLESLVAGTPVLAAAVGGIPSMVEAESNGLLVPPDDAGSLAAALRRLQTDPQLLRRLKRASTPSVLPRFSWARNGEDLMRAIERLAAT